MKAKLHSFSQPPFTLPFVGTLFVLVSCQNNPAVQQPNVVPQAVQPSPPVQAPSRSATPKPVVFKITVRDLAEELSIRPGSFIREGDIIVSTQKQRATLESKKRSLNLKLQNLSGLSRLALETTSEERQLAIADKAVTAAKLDLVEYEKNSPWTDFARSNLPLAAEENEMKRRQDNLQRALATREAVQTQLSKKRVAASKLQAEQAAERQSLEQQLAQVERELTLLRPTRSSHTGTVEKLDIPTQIPGEPVTVTVSLIPGAQPKASPNTALPNQKPVAPETAVGTASDLLPLDATPEALSPGPNPLPPSNSVSE